MARTTATQRHKVRDFGTSLLFNGTSSTVNAGSFSSFLTNLAAGSFTISFWCKLTSSSGTINFGGFSNGGTNTAILFHPNRDSAGATSVGKVNIFMRDNSNVLHNVATTNSVNINNGKWRFVVFTGTPSAHTYQIYIDGVAEATSVQNTTNPTNWTASTFGMGIGARYVSASPTQFFPGYMDGVRFYTTALSSIEVTNLFYGTDPSATSLFSWYKFDEGSGTTATDSAGANTGTIASATYSSDVFMTTRPTATGRTAVSSILGSAVSFSGTNKITIVSASAQDNLTACTISAWIYMTGFGGGGFGRIFHKGPGAVGYIDFNVNSGSGGLISFAADHVTTDCVRNWASPSLSTWHHVLVTYDGGTASTGVHYYLDGTEITATAGSLFDGTGGRGSDSTAIAIGNRTTDTARTFGGSIDEVRLYNRVLTPSEITTLAAKGEVSSGQVGQWPLDAVVGGTTPDYTNGANGTVSGVFVTGTVPLSRQSA